MIGPAVGDYSELVREGRLGVVVNPAARDTWEAAARELLALIHDAPEASARCREAAVSLLSSLYPLGIIHLPLNVPNL